MNVHLQTHTSRKSLLLFGAVPALILHHDSGPLLRQLPRTEAKTTDTGRFRARHHGGGQQHRIGAPAIRTTHTHASVTQQLARTDNTTRAKCVENCREVATRTPLGVP